VSLLTEVLHHFDSVLQTVVVEVCVVIEAVSRTTVNRGTGKNTASITIQTSTTTACNTESKWWRTSVNRGTGKNTASITIRSLCCNRSCNLTCASVDCSPTPL
jgi:hypothetical protein